MQETLSSLKKSYDQTVHEANHFRGALKDQMSDLLAQNQLRPPIPIESRIKEWPSILVKIDRLSASWDDVSEIWDFVGLRFIFLFPEEAAQACALIDQNFNVTYRVDVGQQLRPNQFGYQSVHFTIRLNSDWLKVPSLCKYSSFQAEMQVRTLSQHNWAVASRLLQYGEQSYAPPSVQRSLYRVAALLEVVDLELERVNKERSLYKNQISADEFNEILNVDLLKAILEAYFPETHLLPVDDYANLILDLKSCGVERGTDVIELIDTHLEQALVNDAMALKEALAGNLMYEADPVRLEKGVFYSHVGLMQNILNLQYGDKWREK